MMTDAEVDDFFSGATFGVEYESGVFDRKVPLPGGHSWCTDEVAQHSPCGVGIDPSLRLNAFGGELQLRPESSESGALKSLCSMLDLLIGDRADSMSSGLHVHVRIPQLLERPDVLRHLIDYGQRWEPFFLRAMYWRPDLPAEAGNYARWWYEGLYRQKHWVYGSSAVVRMLRAEQDVRSMVIALHDGQHARKNECYDEFDPKRVKRPQFNYGHLALNGTVEFRMFSTTRDRMALKAAIEFPLRYLRAALTSDQDPLRVIRGLDFHAGVKPLVTDETTADELRLRKETSGYWGDEISRERAICEALVSKRITLADLNYPDYWAGRGFE